jgi:hypothetical protein
MRLEDRDMWLGCGHCIGRSCILSLRLVGRGTPDDFIEYRSMLAIGDGVGEAPTEGHIWLFLPLPLRRIDPNVQFCMDIPVFFMIFGQLVVALVAPVLRYQSITP